MFEATFASQLKRIFDMDKVTYDRPGESQEQEGIFVDVESCQARVIDKRQIARVTGKLIVFAQNNKLPYGYFMKCIDAARPADKRGLFVFELESNRGTYRNIAERSASFVYLFDSQYDPSIGTLEEVNFTESEE